MHILHHRTAKVVITKSRFVKCGGMCMVQFELAKLQNNIISDKKVIVIIVDARDNWQKLHIYM